MLCFLIMYSSTIVLCLGLQKWVYQKKNGFTKWVSDHICHPQYKTK